MKQYKLMGALALTGAFALALSGCAAGNSGSGDNGDNGEKTDVEMADYNPQPRENLQEGGEVNFAIREVPPQLNAFNSDGSADTARIAAWYTPQLILMEPDGTQYKNDNYLDEWKHEVKDGKTVLTFTFTDEAHWNDGTDMDWTAIDATWKANRSYDEGFNPNATDGYKDIESVEQGDTAKTAIVTFKGEFAWPQMPFNGGVIHPALADPDTFNEAMIENPHPEWGAGPYTVDEYDATKGYISFKPNPEWWGDAPLLDKVTMTGMDGQAGVNAFKNGEVDMVETGSQELIDQVKDVDGAKVYRAQQTANTILQVDSSKPQFEDVKVREAFFKAINIDQQKQIAWNGLGYEEDPAGSLTLFSFQPGYTDSMKGAGWEFDVEGAKKLLDEAGWTEGSDGIREKDGVKLSVVYPIWSDTATQKALAQSLQAQEKEVGIDVQVEVRPASQFSEDYTSKNWDVSGLRFTSSDPFGAAWFCQLYCSDSGLNLSGVGDAELDAEIKDKVESQSDPEAQTAAAMELEPEIYKRWGLIPLYNGPQIYTVQEGLANLTPEPYVGLDLFGIQPVENVGWEK
ncbi:ABC transporter family substrate-binding protein [Microbacterium sp. KKR3/1]|uniref:ABC transporter family substrate-binding protein n=1 Tax=unclassified Microbacterium TaxID=2609290 RepID=UPI001E597479|nr:MULTISPECIES: ABC transporter family substrate-binding protein [unclassified Microbacterium]MCE0507618.1 ABC transporter family substrate-binding protein [Microbacterium sp. KKR3/1]UUE19130.1 ABC transporter family substrate-binding protein [Microbacterium sp. J1-1]